MKKIVQKSPSKINLFLKIGKKRKDSYHEIVSLMLPLNLYDTIYIEKKERGKSIIKFSEKYIKKENSVLKALIFFSEAICKKVNVKINVQKKIPSGAGLGGHSSNAVSTLLALNKMFGSPLSLKQMHEISAKISSDSPFFLYKKPAMVFAKGDIVHPLMQFPKLPVVILYPGFSISSKEMYNDFDKAMEQNKKEILTNSEKIVNKLPFLKNVLLNFNIPLKDFGNDFEFILFEKYPKIKMWKEKFLNLGAMISSVSGSGSSVFAIFENLSEAKRIVRKIKKEISENEKVFLCTILTN